MKMCFECGEKPRVGKSSYCQDCLRARNKIYSIRNPYSKPSSSIRTSEQNAAYQAVYRAIISGELIKPSICPLCGLSTSKIQAHHFNGYDKENQLNVSWMCQSCHMRLHKAPASLS